MPDSFNWPALTAAVYRVVAREGTPEDVARCQAAIISPEEVAEYMNHPVGGMQLHDLLAEFDELPG